MNRPVFDRLPDKGYKDNPNVDALTRYYDRKLQAVADNMGSLWEMALLLDPAPISTKYQPAVSSHIDYTLIPTGTPKTLGYTLEVHKNSIYSISSEYPLSERGRSHYIRIVEATRGTVYERSFKARDRHYFTNVKLSAGSYFVSTNYYSEIPIAVSPTQATPLVKPEYTLQRQARYVANDGTVGAPPVANAITPLAIGLQTKAESKLPSKLDYLAYLVGLTGNYWSTAWDVGHKLNTLRNVNALQQWRGTEKALRVALDCHDINYDIFGGISSLKLSFAVVSGVTKFGRQTNNVYVRVPLTAQRRSREYTEAQRAVTNYTSTTSNVNVCYNGFYLGYSTVGEPVFN